MNIVRFSLQLLYYFSTIFELLFITTIWILFFLIKNIFSWIEDPIRLFLTSIASWYLLIFNLILMISNSAFITKNTSTIKFDRILKLLITNLTLDLFFLLINLLFFFLFYIIISIFDNPLPFTFLLCSITIISPIMNKYTSISKWTITSIFIRFTDFRI